MAESARRYHHGEVRRSAQAAAMRLLERDGADALTMRGVASEVGVDHRALYRHLPDRDALLSALAEQGYRELLKAFQTSVKEGRPLHAAFELYIRFALARPHLHALMLTRPRAAMDQDSALYEAVFTVLDHLMDAARQALGGDVETKTAKALAFAGLSSAYGMVSLAATQTLAPREPEALEAFLVEQVYGVLDGQIAQLTAKA